MLIIMISEVELDFITGCWTFYILIVSLSNFGSPKLALLDEAVIPACPHLGTMADVSSSRFPKFPAPHVSLLQECWKRLAYHWGHICELVNCPCGLVVWHTSEGHRKQLCYPEEGLGRDRVDC